MAEDQDITIKCVDCGEDFIFTVGEQVFYREKGLTHAPTRCKKCREKRKGAKDGRRSAPSTAASKPMYAAVCSNCGVETQVPFQPVSGRPILCRDCFQGRKKGGGRAAATPSRRAAGPSDSNSGRPQGSVKWFNESKGFGFIVEDGGEEIFVHFSALQGGGFKTLVQGERVEFDIVPGAKGKQAANVVRIS